MDAKFNASATKAKVVAAKTIPNIVKGEKPKLAIQDYFDNLPENSNAKELLSLKNENA